MRTLACLSLHTGKRQVFIAGRSRIVYELARY